MFSNHGVAYSPTALGQQLSTGSRMSTPTKRYWAEKFVKLETEDGSRSSHVVLGIDPTTKKCTFWQFDNTGCVIHIHVTKAGNNVWLLEGTGSGPDGKCHYRSRVTLIDENHTREEVIEHLVNGEPQPKRTRNWTRKP